MIDIVGWSLTIQIKSSFDDNRKNHFFRHNLQMSAKKHYICTKTWKKFADKRRSMMNLGEYTSSSACRKHGISEHTAWNYCIEERFEGASWQERHGRLPLIPIAPKSKRILLGHSDKRQDKHLSARHQPHGTRQIQIAVGLFQDKILINKWAHWVYYISSCHYP